MNRRILVGIATILLMQTAVFAQNIEKRINLRFSYALNRPLGNDYLKEEFFTLPTLFPHFQDNRSWSVGANMNFPDSYRLGLKFKSTEMSQWSFTENGFYNDTEAYENTIHLTATYLFPVIGPLYLTLHANPYFGAGGVRVPEQMQGRFPPADNNHLISFYSWGIEGAIGFEANLHQNIGLFFDYGINRGWTGSSLFTEKTYNVMVLEVGAILRLYKDKRFKYE